MSTTPTLTDRMAASTAAASIDPQRFLDLAAQHRAYDPVYQVTCADALAHSGVSRPAYFLAVLVGVYLDDYTRGMVSAERHAQRTRPIGRDRTMLGDPYYAAVSNARLAVDHVRAAMDAACVGIVGPQPRWDEADTALGDAAYFLGYAAMADALS